MSAYLTLEITSISKEYDNTLCINLIEKYGRIKEFLPGQFLTLIFNINGEEIRRGFSIASSPNELPNIELAIKKVDEGVFSKYLYDKLKVGDQINSLPPLGNFTIETSKVSKRKIVLIGAGSGITPLFSMLTAILKDEQQSEVTLIYGNRKVTSIIYKKELDQLKSNYNDRFDIQYYLTEPTPDWDGFHGRIDSNVVNQLIESDNNIAQRAHFYLCGPEGMMQIVMDSLKSCGVERDRIHREIYHTSIIDETEEIESKPREVTIIIRGEKYILTVPPGKSILQTALETGLEIPNSCQYGNCGTCKAKHLSGKLKLVNQTVLTNEELENGFCLTCIGYPASENVVILYEDNF